MDRTTPLFFGQPGQPVPSVEPEDLKIVYEFFQETADRNPGASPPAVGISVFQQLCKPGADLPATTYRAMMLGLLTRTTPSNKSDAHWKEQLAPWTKDGHLDPAVFREFARLPMEWMGVGVVTQVLPFDAELFLLRLRGRVE